MPATTLIDYSPNQPSPASKLESASNLILIDNYDSFTWNVYQYLCLEGAKVTVYRNDQVTLDELIRNKPTQLVISPGPGHPDTDSGISNDAIQHFSGKIPVLGVCMGQQCIISAYGGKIEVTGEILHGKTSPLRHDNKGVYASLPQDLPVTRYHSLAGTHPTIPACLEVSSWIAAGPDGGKGVIMGVRHKDFVVEGVQFHPESILTQEGRIMLKNFLHMTGGIWQENNSAPDSMLSMSRANDAASNGPNQTKKASILEKIYDHRRESVAAQKKIPSLRPKDLQASYDLSLSPPQISFPQRLRQSPYPLSLMAEIKRASPSKGIISLDTCAPAQARIYAQAGASVISVLTEPEWFKGSIEDLRAVRKSLEGMPNRPAVLRKEFIFDEYQILEARLAGADTVLLIVKMLDEDTLTRLYRYSRHLGMEPLVEVNTPDEMKIAVGLGAEVIGVNNRDLTSFDVDLETTSRLMDLVPRTTLVCALSGISGPLDVEAYSKDGVKAILVGEALMRASDTAAFVASLLGGSSERTKKLRFKRRAVKICGTRTPEAALAAVKAGADMVGVIRVQGRKRFVPDDVALQIGDVVRTTPRASKPIAEPTGFDELTPTNFFENSIRTISDAHRALLVGVFLDQPLSYILEQQQKLGLDLVQLHGSEPLEWSNLIPVPVLRKCAPDDIGIGIRGYHTLPLLDYGMGGSGTQLDLTLVQKTLATDREVNFILAGGLNPENVSQTFKELQDDHQQIVAVDVSSGVETAGEQDLEKIKDFVTAAQDTSL
ncbi:MAG: hypothetical protein Q9227_006999 [Pyrenula ochraceoflavens]